MQMTGNTEKGTTDQRAVRKKRGAYIHKACYGCKRRKGKCDGEQPCGRCARAGLNCIFPPTASRRHADGDEAMLETELLRAKVALLEEQLRSTTRLSDPLQAHQSRIQLTHSSTLANDDSNASVAPRTSSSAEPTRDSVVQHPEGEISGAIRESQLFSSHASGEIHAQQSPTTLPTPDMLGSPSELFRGTSNAQNSLQTPSDHSYSIQPFIEPQTESSPVHTASTAHYKFNISLAQTQLEARGLSRPDDQLISSVLPTRAASPTPQEIVDNEHQTCDPIWLVDRKEALRLVGVYEEEIGIAYPFLDIIQLNDQVIRLYDSLEAGIRCGFAFMPLRDNRVIAADDLRVIKMVFACALIIETSGSSKLGRRIFDDVKESVRDFIWGDVTVASIIIYLLLAIGHFLADKDFLAWRLTGIVARWGLEIGLNQSLFLQQMTGSEQDRKYAVRLFWCIHTLDRRWSFGSGLPFVIQEQDIAKHYPEPDNGVPYLKAMVAFSRIVSDVWNAIYGNPIDVSSRKGQEEISYLDFRLHRWWDDLPIELKLMRGAQVWSRGMQRLRMLLYLRKCQLTILLHQPVLHYSARIQQRPQTASLVVDTAKDVIRKLEELNRTTDIYQTQQMCFNHFLVLSLGVIFLAVSQAPERFAVSVRKEFHGALDLVQQLSTNSVVSKRLWKTIKNMRELGDRLGVSSASASTAEIAVPRTTNNPQPSDGPVSSDFDPSLFSFENDLQFPFITPDLTFDGSQLTESMEAIFKSMEKDYANDAFDPSIEVNSDDETNMAPPYGSYGGPYTGGMSSANHVSNHDVSRMIAGMIGRA